ncbi:F-box/kelch-repeat protein At4g39560 [Arabidopsis lyrata subsp. lyrata]|nr:F-box/kelch-repeat protein At4g39560 [Arabidopsis lyrata subsp. lyrata]|eukprot:XP_002879471.2 F-box/kelch-repeat protein At4g39560 [Arabidopsis lyrata subsp. lyrata]
MEESCAIGGLELTPRKKKVCGIWSLPDSVALICLAQLSRLDLAAFAIASKEQRSLVGSLELWDLRYEMGCSELSLYVLLHIFPEPNPRWFIFHPVQRRLKPIHSNLNPNPVPEAESAFVFADWGIFDIGGVIKGERTCHVSFFDCFGHIWPRLPSMKIARSRASASLIDDKIYVFGGCTDYGDSSNWAEVFDLRTLTWDFLYVSTPPQHIRQSVLMRDKEEVYVVDEDGQTMSFSPSKSLFVANGNAEKTQEEHLTDWCLFGKHLFCAGKGRRILWCFPYELDWKEVKGLENLQSLCGNNEIINLCPMTHKTIAIFWIVRPHDDDPFILELWSAEISFSNSKRRGTKAGKIH